MADPGKMHVQSQKRILVVFLHILVITLAYSSFLWLDWRLVFIGVVLYYVQLLLFGWCVLSLAQFDGQKISFHEWYLTKLGLKVNRHKLNFALTWIVPFVLLVLAIAIQQILAIGPVVKL